MVVCPSYVRTKFQENVLVGRPPDEQASGKRFATTAPDLAWAIADGIVRERRMLIYPASEWALMMGRGILVGRRPDEQASGKRFAATAPDLAWANADGIVRERRMLVYPASGWALVMGRGMLVERWLDELTRGKRFAVMAWQYWPQVVEAFFRKLQRDHR